MILKIISMKEAYRRGRQRVPKYRTQTKEKPPMLITNTRSKANHGERKETRSLQTRQANGRAKSATQQTQFPGDQKGMSTIETKPRTKARPYHHMKLKLKTHVED